MTRENHVGWPFRIMRVLVGERVLRQRVESTGGLSEVGSQEEDASRFKSDKRRRERADIEKYFYEEVH